MGLQEILEKARSKSISSQEAEFLLGNYEPDLFLAPPVARKIVAALPKAENLVILNAGIGNVAYWIAKESKAEQIMCFEKSRENALLGMATCPNFPWICMEAKEIFLPDFRKETSVFAIPPSGYAPHGKREQFTYSGDVLEFQYIESCFRAFPNVPRDQFYFVLPDNLIKGIGSARLEKFESDHGFMLAFMAPIAEINSHLMSGGLKFSVEG